MHAPRTAIALGQGDRQQAEKIISNSFTVLLAFAVILCNLAADLLARRIDPRLGSGAGGAA